ncbi:hypothetical protein NL676_021364 [Syzygium grande]|nr:hypothetical protein NL676_021364 [Syzygium grande]
MAEAVLFSLATDILKSLATEMAKPGGSFASQNIQLLCCAKDELQSLEGTVQTIQAVLLDAERQQWHNKELKLRLKRLKDMLYDLQDLLDDVATEDLRWKVTSGNKMLKAVKDCFKLKMWVCHGDPKIFDVDLIIKDILKSAQDECRGDPEMRRDLQDLDNKSKDQLQSLLRKVLDRKKYLLVLDDLWNEDRLRWLELQTLLIGGSWGEQDTRNHAQSVGCAGYGCKFSYP